MIADIAKNIKNHTPLTKVQKKNIITIEKLVAEKISPKEVAKFIQALPNKGVERGLESIDRRTPVLNSIHSINGIKVVKLDDYITDNIPS